MTSTRKHSVSEGRKAADRGVVRLRSGGGCTEIAFEELPIAVGFGSPVRVRPRRLSAVPGLPVEFVRPPGSGTPGRVIDLPADAVVALGDVPGPADSGVIRSSPASVLGMRSPAPPYGTESAPLRLTSRGRAVLLVVAAAIGLVVVVTAWFGAGASTPPAPSARPAQIVVHDGDTLWSIATRIAPDLDPRVVVDQLLRVNRLDTPALVPGQVLRTH